MSSNLLLPLRQRQLLSYLEHADGYTTGEELSRALRVSARTIRTDVAQINEVLRQRGVQISSKHRFGYIIESVDAGELRQLTQNRGSFITRQERLRYIALRLCRSEKPVDLDELAEEMYISKTTLEHDLESFRQDYILTSPGIRLIRHKNSVALENNEEKRRKMLCRLGFENWDYNSRGNTYYQYQYLEEQDVNLCMNAVNKYLHQYHLILEDPGIVVLDLSIAVAARRIRDDKHLTKVHPHAFVLPAARSCINDILDALEPALHCAFSYAERIYLAELLSCCIIPDMEKIKAEGPSSVIPEDVIAFASAYLHQLREAYGLDFSADKDFYYSLLIYLRYLKLPFHYLNETGVVRNDAVDQYLVEFELACSIQPLAFYFYGSCLDFNEVMYLALLLSGGLAHIPFRPLRTVVMTHFNQPAGWNVKARLEDLFPGFLFVSALLPMYQKDNYDFTNTDLILSTTDKRIDKAPGVPLIQISPFFTQEDRARIEQYLAYVRSKRLYRRDFPDTLTLLDRAVWHEKWQAKDYETVLKKLSAGFVEGGYASEKFPESILQRERIVSYAGHASYIIVHSHEGVRHTHVEVVTMDHRLLYHNQKIRVIIMLGTAARDRSLIFQFYNDLYHTAFDPQETRFLKTKGEFIGYLRERLPQDRP